MGRVVGHEAHPHLTAADAAGGVEHARQGLQLIGGKVGRQAEDLQPGLVAQGLGLCRSASMLRSSSVLLLQAQ